MIGYIFIIIGLILFISKEVLKYFNKNNVISRESNKKYNYCVLVPARNESRVIEDLIKSIKIQSYKIDMSNVYVIIEDINDPSYKICKKYKCNVIIRKKLDLKRKGYALMEGIHEIVKSKLYDAYFIFDADNILDKDYFKEMDKSFKKGYDVGTGYRLIKNKTNSISTSSHLIFTLINEVSNKNRCKYNININCSGTGFYISGNIINKLKSYPFHSLTEDYEISLYACVNNYSTTYNRDALFYDEEVTNYNSYFKQRTRWVKGYFETRKLYIRELISKLRFSNNNFVSIYNSFIGIYDILFILIGLFIKLISYPLVILLVIYVSLVILSMYLISIEKNFKLSNILYIKTILINPLLLCSYVLCLFKVIFSKDISWDTIEHKEKLDL